MITVGNRKYNHTGEYIGRPSPLGNPFILGTDGDRKTVVRLYKAWFMDQLIGPSTDFNKECDRLCNLAEQEHIKLICWCAPAECHGDVIKQFIENNIDVYKGDSS